MPCVVSVEEVSEWTIAVNVRVYQIIACGRIVISEIGIARVVVSLWNPRFPGHVPINSGVAVFTQLTLVGLEVKRDRMVSRVQSLT